ncbi:MFS transporter [Iodidimonas nitroreducens]|uniref:MFS transporter n=1 Tax=Iodidimonas nitroreducens TaxID=1236968 RepID=A0A5A7N5L5_9PROT|nr:MFS transporter [Iodidimonas nitroreducens]GAK33694.1 L-galactonate transporter [alpha proteobacterium Q-1]GER03591.1 MFS transporter [Iodidimonas nitroreducens]
MTINSDHDRPEDAAGKSDKTQPIPYPSQPVAWGIVALLLLIYTVSFIDRQILALLVGPIKSDLGVSDLEFGLLTGLSFALFYTFFGIPFARLADSRSRRGLIAFGIAFWSLATAACGLARNFGMLFIARMGVGIGEATLTPAANSLISDLFPPHLRGRAISIYTLGIPLGSALAFLFGGAVIAWVSASPTQSLPFFGEIRGWQMTFVIVGLPGILLSAAMLLFVKEPPRRERLNQSTEPVPIKDVARYFLARWRVYGLGFTGIAFLSALGYGTIYFIGAFFGRVHGFSPAEIGLTFGLILLIFGTAGIVFAGILADRWVAQGRSDAHVRILILSIVFGAPFALSFPLVSSPALAIALLSGAVFFSNWVWGTAYAGVAAASPNELRGQATAIYLFVINLIGLGLGPTLFGFLTTKVFADDQMIDWAYVVVALIAMPIAFICLMIARPAFARQFDEVNRL